MFSGFPPAALPQALRDCLDRLLMGRIQQMCVDHGRCRDCTVPQRAADVVDRRAGIVRERRKRVPQSMQSQLGQMVPADECAECLGQIIRQIWLTVRPRQHIARVLILLAKQQPVLALPPPFDLQHADDLVRHVQQTGRGTVFGVLFNHL